MHEPRTRDRRGPERRSGVRRLKVRFRAALLIAIAAIAVLALEVIANRERLPEGYIALAAPPQDLMGTWATENPRYADRSFLIADDHVELHLGVDGGIRAHPILSIRGLQGPDSWTYEIDYESPDGDRTLAVHLHQDGVLRLRNPADMVWRREPTG